MGATDKPCPICGMPLVFKWLMDGLNPTESVRGWRCPSTRCVYQVRDDQLNKEEKPCGLGECWCW